MGFFNWFSTPADRLVTIGNIRFNVSFSQEDGQEKYRVDLLSIPAISSAIETKSNDVSQIPAYVYLRGAAGRVRMRGQLDYRLSQQPNRYQNAATFWKTVAMQATVGECFVNTRGGELNILPFGSAVKYVTALGEVRYATCYTKSELTALGHADPNAVVIKDDFAYGEVLHFWTYQDEAGVPVPMRSRFRHVLGLGSDVYAYTTNIYNRGGTIAGYLSTDKQINDDKKAGIIQAFKAIFKSSKAKDGGNDMLMAAVDNGWKFNALNLTPQEMMLLETKKDLQRDFAQITNMPLWKLGVLEDYHYATAEAAQREYLQSSLNPLLNQIERELNSKLVADYERDFIYIEFDRDALITLDAKTMADVDDLAIKNGGMSLNEWRSRRNLSAVEGGDMRQVPVNVTSAGYVAQAEALKLESSRLDVAIKQAQLAAMQKPLAPVTLGPPGPATPAASDSPDYAASLGGIQAKYLADAVPDQLRNADVVGGTVRAICSDVAALHDLTPDHLATFADKYVSATVNRIASVESIDMTYEVNRAVNAANHEAIKLRHGVTKNVRWVGGANDGKVQSVNSCWQNTLRHPPITDGECDCFLVPENL